MCRAAEHARSQSKVIRSEVVNKVGTSRYVESNKGSFDNSPSTNTKWCRNQQVKTSVQNRQQKLPNGTPCQQCGGCDVTVESKSAIQCHQCHVIKGAHGSLIDLSTAQELGLVNIVNKIGPNWEDKNPGLTKGIGKLKGVQVKLHIDESVRPVAITKRKIPFHMRPKIKEKLRRLKEDTIEKVPVGDPTPWVSPIIGSCMPMYTLISNIISNL